MTSIWEIAAQVFSSRDNNEAQLQSRIIDPIASRLNQFSDRIAEAIKTVCVQGRDAINNEVDQIMSMFQLYREELKEQAQSLEYEAVLFLDKKFKELVATAIQSYPIEIGPENGTFRIESIEVVWRLNLSASVKASLVELLTILAAGELEAKASYRLARTDRARTK